MAVRTIIECDFCGREKTETNHWSRLIISDRGFSVYPYSRTDVKGEDVKYACSESEITKALSEWLSQQIPVVDK